MNDISQNKKKLREEYRRRRDGFVTQLAPAISNLVFRRPPSPLAKLTETRDIIAIYHAIGSEAPTARLIEYFAEIGKTIAFPVASDANPLTFRAVDKLELLQKGYRDIPEPGPESPQIVPEIIIAPLVAFDRKLGRLGQGGGHYDRTFAQLPDIPRIGLAWSVQEAQEIPLCRHDVTLDMVVTESEVIQ